MVREHGQLLFAKNSAVMLVLVNPDFTHQIVLTFVDWKFFLGSTINIWISFATTIWKERVEHVKNRSGNDINLCELFNKNKMGCRSKYHSPVL